MSKTVFGYTYVRMYVRAGHSLTTANLSSAVHKSNSAVKLVSVLAVVLLSYSTRSQFWLHLVSLSPFKFVFDTCEPALHLCLRVLFEQNLGP